MRKDKDKDKERDKAKEKREKEKQKEKEAREKKAQKEREKREKRERQKEKEREKREKKYEKKEKEKTKDKEKKGKVKKEKENEKFEKGNKESKLDALERIERGDIVSVCSGGQVEEVILSKKQKCKNCCKSFVAFLFSTIGLTCLMVGYTVLGGVIFMELEAAYETQQKNNIRQTRQMHVELLWNLTMDLNWFFKDNWTILADGIMESYTKEVYEATKVHGWDGKDGLADVQWTFAGSMLYSITVITTIGYGHIAPKTDWGRVVTILYALVGIPLTLLTLANLGGFMATAFRFIYKNICCGICCICCLCCRRRTIDAHVRSATIKYNDPKNGDPGATTMLNWDENINNGGSRTSSPQKYGVKVVWRRGIQRMFNTEDNKRVSVPIYVSVLVLAGYIASGALMFTIWEENWSYLVGCYFCFVTLTTIGFGDFVPGTSIDSMESQEKLVLVSLYLLFGLALIAMCFDLMQEEARNKCRALGKRLGLLKKDK